MTKRMNMSIEEQEPISEAPVDTVFRLEMTDDGEIRLRAKTPDFDWHILIIKADGTLKREYGMGPPFQSDGEADCIKLSE